MPDQDVKKIIWAVDPFALESKMQRSVVYAIRALMKGQAYQVEPVFILSGFTIDVSLDLPKDYFEQVHVNAQKALDKMLSRDSFAEIKSLRVFSKPYLPIRQGIGKLISYAQEEGAHLIAMGTHARKGMGRLLMGSFAETMVMHSDIPLLIVNPFWNRATSFKHILFPTDFSEASRRAYGETLLLAKALSSEITLFHKMEYGLAPALELSTGAAPTFKNEFKKAIDQRHIEAWRWRDEGKSQGIQVNIYIDYRLHGRASEAILSFIRKKPGLIAMAAQSGAIRTMLLGSVTRRVVRASPSPVWVWHPQPRREITSLAG